jgi:hypothetical protein
LYFIFDNRKAQLPKDPELNLPFPFEFDFSKRINLADKKILIDCNPCKIHGRAIINVKVHGELFKPNPKVVGKIGIEQESVFNVTSYMDKGLNINERKNLFVIPLGKFFFDKY